MKTIKNYHLKNGLNNLKRINERYNNLSMGNNNGCVNGKGFKKEIVWKQQKKYTTK